MNPICPACGDDGVSRLHGTPDGGSVLRCSSCGEKFYYTYFENTRDRQNAL